MERLVRAQGENNFITETISVLQLIPVENVDMPLFPADARFAALLAVLVDCVA